MKRSREEGNNILEDHIDSKIVTCNSKLMDVELPSEEDFVEMLRNDASNWGNQSTRPMGYSVYTKYTRSC